MKASLGIDARQFRLLVDLFDLLSDRGEMLDQLGRNGVALRTVTWAYAFFSALLSILMVLARPAPITYASSFMILTAFLLLIVLLSETGNSLVNPEEGLILAQQPVNGATYTAAKLTHLARIVFFLTMGLNTVPAFLGLLLKGASWSYPLFHLAAALAVGLASALLCCALYGWLMRFVPVRRLKAAGQLSATLPFLGMMLWQHTRRWLPRFSVPGWLALPAAAAAIVIVVLGFRSLSADYLIRVSSIMHSGSSRRGSTRRSRMGGLVARWFGGQPARAGFAFVCSMMRRDFQFRRQAGVMAIIGLGWVAQMLAQGWRTDPFSGRFTTIHLLPHMLGLLLLSVCSFLAYGNDFKGAWIFLLAPAQAFDRFAGGVWAALWFQVIVAPHVIMLLSLAWPWGIPHAALFVAYSAAVASTYLALALRLIEGAPFSSQMDPTRSAAMLPMMILGGIAVAVAVGVQYFLVFRSAAIVVASTVVLGAAAYLLTRWSLGTFAASIRWRLGLLSAEIGSVYREVDV